MPSNESLFDVVVEQSHQLQKLILEGELEEAERLEYERSQTIKLCFSDITSIKDPQKAIECIRQVMEMDTKSISEGNRLSAELKEDLARLQKGHQAIRAYQDVER